MYRDTKNVEYECIIIPVVIGATGIVTKDLKKNLEAIPEKKFKLSGAIPPIPHRPSWCT